MDSKMKRVIHLIFRKNYSIVKKNLVSENLISKFIMSFI